MRTHRAGAMLVALLACSDGSGRLQPGPDDLFVALGEDRVLAFQWSVAGGKVDTVELEGRLGDRAWEALGTLPGDDAFATAELTAWPDDATWLAFRVRGRRADVATAWSNEARVLTRPPWVRFVTAAPADRATGAGPVHVAWANPSRVVTQAIVERVFVSGEGVVSALERLAVPDGATSLDDRPLPFGQAAFYRVRYTTGYLDGPDGWVVTAFAGPALAEPQLELVPGVGVRALAPTVPRPGVRLEVSGPGDRSAASRELTGAVGLWPSWPPSPVARYRLGGVATFDAPLWFQASVTGATSRLSPFTIAGEAGRFLARSRAAPAGPAARGAGDPLHVLTGCTAWREDPAGWKVLPDPQDESSIALTCLAPAVDRAGRLHVLRTVVDSLGRTVWDATFDGATWTSARLGPPFAGPGEPTVARWFGADGRAWVVVDQHVFHESEGGWSSEVIPQATSLQGASDGTLAWWWSGGWQVRDAASGAIRNVDVPADAGSILGFDVAPGGAMGLLSARPLAAPATGWSLEWRALGPAGWSDPEPIAVQPQPSASLLGRSDGGAPVVLTRQHDLATDRIRLAVSRRGAAGFATTVLVDDAWSVLPEDHGSAGLAGGAVWLFQPTLASPGAGWRDAAIYEEQ